MPHSPVDLPTARAVYILHPWVPSQIIARGPRTVSAQMVKCAMHHRVRSGAPECRAQNAGTRCWMHGTVGRCTHNTNFITSQLAHAQPVNCELSGKIHMRGRLQLAIRRSKSYHRPQPDSGLSDKRLSMRYWPLPCREWPGCRPYPGPSFLVYDRA